MTTPQEVALSDVRKAYNMFDQLRVPILGIVENMSYFECPNDGEKFFIFGNGGGEALAEAHGAPFLGAIPIAINIREGGDLGAPDCRQPARQLSGEGVPRRRAERGRAGQRRGVEGGQDSARA